MSVSRRDLLKRMLMATAGTTLSAPSWQEMQWILGSQSAFHVPTPWSDAYKTMEYLAFYRALGHFFPNGDALAAIDDEETCIVTIKVMNLIHSPLLFKFTDYTGPKNNAAYAKGWAEKISSTAIRNHLLGKGIDKEPLVDRFKKLKLNQWWSDILNSGIDETGKTPSFVDQSLAAPFPGENDVAIQAALHLNQNITALNHSFKNTTMPLNPNEDQGGDINFHLAMQNLVNSPLGIACLNMGTTVETTDAIGRVANRVLGSDLERVEADGQSVASYVNLLTQSVGIGYLKPSLVETFDTLAATNSDLRKSLISNRPNIAEQLGQLSGVADIASELHAMAGLNANNIQAFSTGSATAKYEFLSQCMFVAKALDLPGKPLRNFSLMLNIFDLDTSKFDVATSQDGSEPLSNIEGMRQLAMGMNILGQTIKKHKNVYVVVVSEGGRGSNGGDNKVSSAFLMGPGGKGNLKDHLYANNEALTNPNDPFNTEPNEGDFGADNSPGLTVNGAGLRSYSEGELRKDNGLAEKVKFPSVGEFLNGVVKHIEDKAGHTSTRSGLGGYIDIKKS